MAINDGIGNPVRDPFPGIALPDGSGAPGSAGASGRPADSAGATVTPPAGTSQDRYPAAAGTVQPDQVSTNQIVPGPASGLTSTGAGQGSGSHYPRRSWQDGGSDGE
jgi:hypothetical protein